MFRSTVSLKRLCVSGIALFPEYTGFTNITKKQTIVFCCFIYMAIIYNNIIKLLSDMEEYEFLCVCRIALQDAVGIDRDILRRLLELGILLRFRFGV